MTTRNHTYRAPYERIMTIMTRRGATINDAWLTRDGIDGKPNVAISVTEDTAEPYESVTLATYPNLVGGKAIATLYDGNTIYRLPTYQGMMARAAMGGVLPGINLHTSRTTAEEVLRWFNVDAEAARELLKPLGGRTGATHDPVDPLAAAQRAVKAQQQTIKELRDIDRRKAELIATLRARVDQYAPVLADVERLARERKDTIDKHAKTIADQNHRLANQAKTIIADQATIDDLNADLRIASQRDAAHQEEIADLKAKSEWRGAQLDRYQKAYGEVFEERDNLRGRQEANRATIDRLRKQVEEQTETIGGLKTRNLALVATARYNAKVDALGQPTSALADSYQERGEIIAKQGRDLDRTKDLLARWKDVAESRYKAALSANQEITALTEQRDDAHDTIDSLRALVARQAKEHKRLNRHLNRIRSAATQLRHSVADGSVMYPVVTLLNTIDTEEGES